MPLPVPPGVQHADCPGCGKLIVLDEAKYKASHEFPECEWWLGVLAQHVKPTETIVEVMNERGELVPPSGKA